MKCDSFPLLFCFIDLGPVWSFPAADMHRPISPTILFLAGSFDLFVVFFPCNEAVFFSFFTIVFLELHFQRFPLVPSSFPPLLPLLFF